LSNGRQAFDAIKENKNFPGEIAAMFTAHYYTSYGTSSGTTGSNFFFSFCSPSFYLTIFLKINKKGWC